MAWLSLTENQKGYARPDNWYAPAHQDPNYYYGDDYEDSELTDSDSEPLCEPPRVNWDLLNQTNLENPIIIETPNISI